MKESPRRIAIVGGSTVYGQGDPDGSGFVGRFRAVFEPRSERHRVFNLGVGGDTVEMMLARAPREAQARRAELIFCYPGFNDIKRIGSPSGKHTDLGKFRLQAAELVRELSRVAPTVIMTAVPIDESRTQPFRGDMYFSEADALLITLITREVALELEVPCLDIFAAWINRADRKQLLADGLHANAAGHSLVAGQLKEFVDQNCL